MYVHELVLGSVLVLVLIKFNDQIKIFNKFLYIFSFIPPFLIPQI